MYSGTKAWLLLLLPILAGTSACETRKAALSQYGAARLRAEAKFRALSDNFLGSLPKDDDEINASEATLDDPFWRVYLDIPDTRALSDFIAADTLGKDPPDIAPFEPRPLIINGQEVQEISNKRARNRIAVAACKDGKPVIYWSPFLMREVSPYSRIFFRQHEAAHLRLHHVICGSSHEVAANYPSSPGQEVSADCSAREALDIPGTGQQIIGSAFERLWAMNMAADSRYPASRERAIALRNKCAGVK